MMFEITNHSESLKKFEEELMSTADAHIIEYKNSSGWNSWSVLKRIVWVVLCFYFWPIMIFVILFSKWTPNKLTASEKQRANIVENYLFSRDHVTTVETLAFIQNQIQILQGIEADLYSLFWTNIWFAKAKEIYSNALSSGNHEKSIEKTYNIILEERNRIEKRVRAKRIIKALIISAFIIGIVLFEVRMIKWAQNYQAEREEKMTSLLEQLPENNVISYSDVQLTGILAECFEVNENDVLISLNTTSSTIGIELSLKCTDNLKEKLEKLRPNPSISISEYSSAQITFNGKIKLDANALGKEGAATKAAFEELLKANEGEIVTLHLTYDYAMYEDFSSLLVDDNLIVSISLKYAIPEDE